MAVAYFGAANFWNPVGWIVGGLGVVALALSWFFGDREKKLQRQKNQDTTQLRAQIDFMEQSIVKATKRWFYKNITSGLVRGIRKETPQLYDGMFQLSRALRKAAFAFGEDIEVLNRRLLIRCGALVREKITEDSISDIARDPGIKTKFIYATGAVSSSFCREVGKALGEWIDKVDQAPFQKMIAAALCPARVKLDKIEEVSFNPHITTVRISASQMGRAIGKGGSNVRLAALLMKTYIRLQKEE